MWQVEARNPNGDFSIESSLSKSQSRKRHSDLSLSGKWSLVRSFDTLQVISNVNASVTLNDGTEATCGFECDSAAMDWVSGWKEQLDSYVVDTVTIGATAK